SHHDKTEAPTPRRRERAREEGQVAQSPELTGAIVMFLAALALRRVGPLVGGGLERVLADTLPMVRGTSSGIWESVVWGRWFCWNLLLTSGGVLGGMLVLGLTASALQVGVRVTPQALSLKWERLSPVAGWGKLFSMDGAVRGLNTLMKLAL